MQKAHMDLDLFLTPPPSLPGSGGLSGNYYVTPRPVHTGPESPPITYQEHRNPDRQSKRLNSSHANEPRMPSSA